MPIPMLTRFTYGLTGDWTPALPPRAWTPIDETVGGRRISSAGVPATFVVRRDMLIELTLRFEEDEWAAALALIDYGQSGQAFRWYPDATLTDEGYDSAEVYLQTPSPGERFAPTRDGQYPRMFEVTIVLRGVGGILPFTPYYTT